MVRKSTQMSCFKSINININCIKKCIIENIIVYKYLIYSIYIDIFEYSSNNQMEDMMKMAYMDKIRNSYS